MTTSHGGLIYLYAETVKSWWTLSLKKKKEKKNYMKKQKSEGGLGQVGKMKLSGPNSKMGVSKLNSHPKR